jgi:hypothetical protein
VFAMRTLRADLRAHPTCMDVEFLLFVFISCILLLYFPMLTPLSNGSFVVLLRTEYNVAA